MISLDYKIDSSALIKSSESSSTSNIKNYLPFCSSINHFPPHSKDNSSSSNLRKEILGPRETLFLPSYKNITERTLGAYKSWSSSYLVTSSSSKPKATATRHLKSSFKTMSKTSHSTYSSSYTSSMDRSLILTSQVNGEESLIFSTPTVLGLITLLLL